jgi:hypothetical protein
MEEDVAKSRRPVKKKTAKKKASAKPKPAKKVVRKAKKAARPAAPKSQKLELKKLRAQFGHVLALLAAKQGVSPEVTTKLDDTRMRISQWMTDIDDICSPELQEICGPDMAFPLP